MSKKASMLLALLLISGSWLARGVEPAPQPECASPSAQTDAWSWPIIWYLPNRLMDLEDIVSLSLSAGTASAADVKLTAWADFGWYSGRTYSWQDDGYDRHYGISLVRGYRYNLGPFHYSDLISEPVDNWYNRQLTEWFAELEEQDPAVKKAGVLTDSYLNYSYGFSLVNPEASLYQDRDVDLWAIGAQVGFLLGAEVMVHPVEIADCVVGFFGLDLSNDDI